MIWNNGFKYTSTMNARTFGSGKAREYYGLANFGKQFGVSIRAYKRSLPITITLFLIGLLVAVGSREILQRDDLTMNSGMMVLLTLCASFVQFAGTQESYTTRTNAVQAFTLLEQLCLEARIGRFEKDMYDALVARYKVANRRMVEEIDHKTGLKLYTPFVYMGEADQKMQKMALNSTHAASALRDLAAFDMLCRMATPRTMVQPIMDMYILTFGFVMPQTIFPIMSWWYLLFSFYPIFICIGSYLHMCEAGNFLTEEIPEYKALFNDVISTLGVQSVDKKDEEKKE